MSLFYNKHICGPAAVFAAWTAKKEAAKRAITDFELKTLKDKFALEDEVFIC